MISIVLKSVLKYKDHLRIKAIEKVSKLTAYFEAYSLFNFTNVEKREILNEIVNLDALKSC